MKRIDDHESRARRARARRRRSGFTLLELMVALMIGTLIVATMYTIGGASSRAFQEQQRISQLQLATRMAMERVRRDVALAGFGATPDSAREMNCGSLGLAGPFRAVTLIDHDSTGMSALAQMPGASRAATQADRIQLLGNYATSDTYLIGNTGDASAASILLQSNWQGFRRSFTSDPLGATVDTALFAQVFAPGRILHVTHPRGFHFFTRITSSAVDSAGRTPRIGISPSLPAQQDCNFALCIGCTVAPMLGVEYGIDTANNVAPTLVPRDVQVTGTNTVLYRREFDPSTGAPIANSTRVVLEYAVNFDVHPIVDQAAVGNPPQLSAPLADGAVITNPARVRALTVALAGRTQEIDPHFPWPYGTGTRPATDPLTAFQPFTDREGASRVRTSMAEILLPNLVARGL